MALELNKIYCADCLDLMKEMEDNSVDLVLTDPPYPDYHADLYHYYGGIIDFLKDIPCRQLIFWSAKMDFPLDYSAVHIWDKKTGCGSEYERIYERNGNHNYKMYRYYLINSTVAASYTKDVFTGHPSQKPYRLIEELINTYSEERQTIFDPFLGSGTTAVACINTGRNFIGIEKDEDYFEIAQRRIKDAQEQERIDQWF